MVWYNPLVVAHSTSRYPCDAYSGFPMKNSVGRCLVEVVERRTLLAAGEYLDSFSGDGIAETGVAGRFNAVHVLPGGKILAGGFSQRVDDTGNLGVVLARFNSDGSPDPSFGTAGLTQVALGLGHEITRIFTDGIGRIFVATSGSATLRFTASGRLDTRFGGGDGFLPRNPVAGVLPDGRFITVRDDTMRRLTPNGGTDSTFGVAGATSVLVRPDLIRRVGAANLLIAPDGALLLGTGLISQASPTESRFALEAVVKFTGDGVYDSSFGAGGFVSIARREDFGSPFAAYSSPALAFDRSNRVVSTSLGGLWRFDQAGRNLTQLDASGSGTQVNVDSKGRIILLRQFDFSDGATIERRLADGTLDIRFAGDGETSATSGVEGNVEVFGVALTGGDDLVLATSFRDFDINTRETVAALGKLSGTNPTTPAHFYEPGGLLVVFGTAAADRIRVLGEGDTITVSFGSTTQRFASQNGQDIRIYGENGSDDIEASASFINCVAYGGPGDDRIFLRRFRRASAYGDTGNDTINIFARDNGGATGGDGNDSITIDLFSGNARAAGATGGNGNDLLIGGRQKDFFSGDAGNDTIHGMGDDDRIFGNAGNDVLDGGSGNDRVSGGTGNDTLNDTGGFDNLEGGDGDDFYDSRDNRVDAISEVGGTFYGFDRARIDLGLDLVGTSVEEVTG